MIALKLLCSQLPKHIPNNLFMKMSRFVICLLMTVALQFPLHGWAQKKQLTPVNLPPKIASVDMAKLRSNYKAYSAAKDSLFKVSMAKRNAFDAARNEIDQESKKQLKKDSSAGGKQKDLIESKASAKRYDLESKMSVEVKERRQKGQAMINDYEGKINAAIRGVMAEGIYTQLKTAKDSSGIQGTDITDLVLRKLN